MCPCVSCVLYSTQLWAVHSLSRLTCHRHCLFIKSVQLWNETSALLFPHLWKAFLVLQHSCVRWSVLSTEHFRHWQCFLTSSLWGIMHHGHMSGKPRTKRAFAVRIKLHSSQSIWWTLESCRTLNFKSVKQLFKFQITNTVSSVTVCHCWNTVEKKQWEKRLSFVKINNGVAILTRLEHSLASVAPHLQMTFPSPVSKTVFLNTG